MELLGVIAALLSAASWAFGTVMFERIGRTVPSLGITFFKGLFSIILMVVLIFFSGGIQTIRLTEFGFLSLSGIIGIAIGDTLFFKSLQDVGAKSQVIFFLLGQILTMVLSLAVLNELLSVSQYVGASILLVGVVVVIWGKQEEHPKKARGLFWGLLSILCFSVSSILIKMAVGNVEVITATFYRMFFGTIFTLGFGAACKQIKSWYKPLTERSTLLLFLLNVIVITYGGFVLSMAAIKYIPVSLASILGTTEPIFVLVLAFLVNKDKIKAREAVGAMITIIGLYFIIKG